MKSVPQIRPSGRLDGLQGARGVAAALVVLFHAAMIFGESSYIGRIELSRLFAFGYSGVLLFFVISGFIMMHAHWNDPDGGPAALRFAKRRLLRIYPPAILIVLVMAAAGPTLARLSGDPLLAGPQPLALLSSLTLIPFTCQFVPGVLWSLVNEMCFYAIFLIRYVNRTVFLVALAMWSAGVIAGPALVPGFGSPCAGSFLSAYNAVFAFGVAAYFASVELKRRGLPGSPVALLVAGCLVFAASAALDLLVANDAIPVNGAVRMTERFAYAAGSALLVTGLVLIDDWSTLPGRGLLVLLGDASYAIYLVHAPVVGVWARAFAGLKGDHDAVAAILNFAALIAVCLVAGVLAHRYVETPMLSALKRLLKPHHQPAV